MESTPAQDSRNATTEIDRDREDSATGPMSCDVLVVGYGPVGMTAAALLAHYGLSVIAVDRHPARYQWHRAGHFDGETMRIFQRLGIAEAVELVAQPMLSMELRTPEGEVLSRVESGQGGSGWKSDYIAYQPDYEGVIDPRGRELGVRVLMGTQAVAITQSGAGVDAVVRAADDDDAETRTIHARYVIGADGANSFVRSTIGSSVRDLGFHSAPHLVVDFEFADPDGEFPGLPEAAQLLDPRRPQLAGRWGGRRHTRWEFAVLDGESRVDLASEENCWKLLGTWGIRPEHGTIVRSTVYDFVCSITDSWRSGRVLLMGDAAHTMPPYLGQGMQSGLRDAENLAWKLAAVLSGRADDSLLDTYQTEREPHARSLIGMSSALGGMLHLSDPEQVQQRNEMLRSGARPPMSFPRLGPGLVRQPDDAGALDAPGGDGRPSLQARVARGTTVDRLDNLLPQPGWRIVSRHAVPLELFSARQRALLDSLGVQFAHVSRGATGETSFWDIDAEYDRWYRNTGRRAFLERPDHYVFGAVETIEDLPLLIDELAGKLARAGWQAAYEPELASSVG